MSTIIGDATIDEIPGSGINQDVYGVDVLTRKFHGEAADYPRFVRTYTDLKPDHEYPWMLLTNRNPSFDRGGQVRVELTFKGLKNNFISKPHFEQDITRQTVTLKRPRDTSETNPGDRPVVTGPQGPGFVDTSGGASMEVTYDAPVTIITYATGRRPFEPLFPKRMLQQKLAFRIIRTRGARGKIIFPTVQQVISGNLDEVFLAVRIVTNFLSAKQVGGGWQVTERNQGEIVDAREPNLMEEFVGVTRR